MDPTFRRTPDDVDENDIVLLKNVEQICKLDENFKGVICLNILFHEALLKYCY